MPKTSWHLLPRDPALHSNQHFNGCVNELSQSQSQQSYPRAFVHEKNESSRAKSGKKASSNGKAAMSHDVKSNQCPKNSENCSSRKKFSMFSRHSSNFSSYKNDRDVEFSHKDDDFPSLPQQDIPEDSVIERNEGLKNKTYSDKLQNANLSVQRNFSKSDLCTRKKMASTIHNCNTSSFDHSVYANVSCERNLVNVSLSPTYPSKKCWIKPFCAHIDDVHTFDVNKSYPTKQKVVGLHDKQSQTVTLCGRPTENSNNLTKSMTNIKSMGTAVCEQSITASDLHTSVNDQNKLDIKIKHNVKDSWDANSNSQKNEISSKENENKPQNESIRTRKTHKNRKSKLKRNLAFQTGKITILTPEMHSLYTGCAIEKNSTGKQTIFIDVENTEEYPELSSVTSYQSSYKKKQSNRENLLQVQNSAQLDYSKGFQDSAISKNNAVMEHSVKTVKEKTLMPLGEKCIMTEKHFGDVLISTQCCKENTQLITLTRGESTDYVKESSTIMHKSKKHDTSLEVSFSEFLSFANVKIKSDKNSKCAIKDAKVKIISTKKSKISKNPSGPHNVLDSSSPAVKRGKEREIPKSKKYTALKKVILKERKEKKEKQNNPFAEIKEPFCESASSNSSCQRLIQSDLGSSVAVDVPVTDDKLTINPKTSDTCQTGDLENNILERKDITELETEIDISSNSLSKLDDFEASKSKAIQLAIHTRNFREYCNHLLSVEIDELASSLLGNLTRFQDRMHQKDPVKARIKRRLVFGIKEVKKHLKAKKLKCVIVAPDLENIQAKGGLNHAVTEMVSLCTELCVPCIFALRRKNLGKSCLKPVPVSCVGIFNYEGSEACFKKLVEMQEDSKKSYESLTNCMKEVLLETDVLHLLEAQRCSPAAMQAARIDVLRDKLLVHKADLSIQYSEQGIIKFIYNKD